MCKLVSDGWMNKQQGQLERFSDSIHRDHVHRRDSEISRRYTEALVVVSGLSRLEAGEAKSRAVCDAFICVCAVVRPQQTRN